MHEAVVLSRDQASGASNWVPARAFSASGMTRCAFPKLPLSSPIECSERRGSSLTIPLPHAREWPGAVCLRPLTRRPARRRWRAGRRGCCGVRAWVFSCLFCCAQAASTRAIGMMSSVGMVAKPIWWKMSLPTPCNCMLAGLTSDGPNATSPPKFIYPRVYKSRHS